MKTLPDLPPFLRLLSDPEVDRLESLDPTLARSVEDCPTCQGKKEFDRRVPGSSVERPAHERWKCNCRAQYYLQRHFRHCGIGDRYASYTWADAHSVPDNAREVARKYAKKFEEYAYRGRGIIFYGDKGTGKTLLEVLLLKTLLAQGKDCYFTTFSDLLNVFQQTWRDDAERAWFNRRVRNADVLAIDDIGRENEGRNRVADDALDSIIRHRVNARKPTIVTTNYALNQIEQAYSTNVFSLLTEVSVFCPVNGPDYRRHALAYDDYEIDADLYVRFPYILGSEETA